jgi:hypothetical protein
MSNRHMIRRVTAITLLLGFLATATAEARPVALSKHYETDKKIGAGLMLGSPTAISVKYLFTPAIAVDLGVGMNVIRKRDGFHLNADLLWHPFVAIEGNTFLAPLYLGGGFRYLSHHERTGIRFPLGISFDFEKSPIDIFSELAVIYDLSMVEEAEGVLDINLAMGIRYYF